MKNIIFKICKKIASSYYFIDYDGSKYDFLKSTVVFTRSPKKVLGKTFHLFKVFQFLQIPKWERSEFNLCVYIPLFMYDGHKSGFR